MNEEQAGVKEDEAEAKARSGESEGDQEDLDSVLNEFDEGTEAKPVKEPEKPDEFNEVVSYVRTKQQEEAKQRLDRDISKAVDSIKGDDLNLPDKLVRGALFDEAENNPKFLKAFQMREDNPDAWGRALNAIGRQLRDELESIPDRQLSEDREAARASVRGSLERNENAESFEDKINSMSPAEFRRWRDKQAKSGRRL